MEKEPVDNRSSNSESGSDPISQSSHDLTAYINENPGSRQQFLHYLSRLWMKYSMLRLNVMMDLSVEDESISLPAMYIQLNTETKIRIGKDENIIGDNSDVWLPSKDTYLYRRILTEIDRLKFRAAHTRFVSAVEIFEYHPRLVLIGAPGSGKSTFLQYLTLCMAGEILQRKEANLHTLNTPTANIAPVPWPHGALLPVYVELKLFTRSNCFPRSKTRGAANDLLNYIDSTVLPGRDPEIRTLIASQPGNVLIMLDGLDEVEDAKQDRDCLREAIADFVECHPKCRLIVTTRPYAYRNDEWRLEFAGFKEATIAALDKSQVKGFITRWYERLDEGGQVGSEIRDERVVRLTTSIDKYPYLNNLVATPLLLTMLVTLSERSGGLLPVDRADLYEESVKILLDRWNAQRGLIAPILTDELGIGLETLRDRLERIAFEIHKESKGSDTTEEISYQQLHSALATIPTTANRIIDDAMKYLHQRSGILVADSPDHFRFPHRSFQEYLAACYLLGHEDYPDLLARLAIENPVLWRDVLLFAARRAVTYRQRDVWELVAELCPDPIPNYAPKRMEWQGPLFAGLVMLEATLYEQETPHRYQAVLERVRGWLVACLGSPEISLQERYEVGLILGKIGDPRSGIRVTTEDIPNIEWKEIPAGAFLMGSRPEDKAAYSNEFPQSEVTLEKYYISKYPITVSQYRSFIESKDGQPFREKFQNYYKENPEINIDNYPVVGVAFEEAENFCKWLGKLLRYEIRLPRQEEWEKAARGSDGRLYPWGPDFDNNRCNINNNIGKLCAVGIFPNGESPYHVSDTMGNTWEWTSSLWREETGLSKDIYEIRGGAFSSAPEVTRCAFHGHQASVPSSSYQGLRIVTFFKKE